MLERIVINVLRALFALGTFALMYWATRIAWDANPMFAAGAAVTAAVVIWNRAESS